MNVLLLNSSYRTNGNTALALGSLKSGLLDAGIGVDELNLAHEDIQPCRGCRVCFDRGTSVRSATSCGTSGTRSSPMS
jgi:multimeric flavodoxin WrbA